MLATNGLGWVLAAAGVLVVGAGAVVAAIEPDVGGFGDAVWWAIVTATTVGYGDIAPTSIVGRGVATLLMVVGIGTIGMLTGSVATYFLDQRDHQLPAEIAHVEQRLNQWEDLTPAERHRLAVVLAACADDRPLDERPAIAAAPD